MSSNPMNLFKQPSITEWLFGVVIIMTPSIAGLIVYLPLRFLTGELSKALLILQLGVVLVGVAVVPVIVFRWSRFFVRVATRKLFRQNQQGRHNAPA